MRKFLADLAARRLSARIDKLQTAYRASVDANTPHRTWAIWRRIQALEGATAL
jgi:hypothetical protein